MLYKQFVAWNYNGCSIAPLTGYANNLIYQELPTEGEYFTNADERVYIDLRDSKEYTGELEKIRRDNSEEVLKVKLNGAFKKMRLRVWGCLQVKYLYLVTERGITMKYHIT